MTFSPAYDEIIVSHVIKIKIIFRKRLKYNKTRAVWQKVNDKAEPATQFPNKKFRMKGKKKCEFDELNWVLRNTNTFVYMIVIVALDDRFRFDGGIFTRRSIPVTKRLILTY